MRVSDPHSGLRLAAREARGGVSGLPPTKRNPVERALQPLEREMRLWDAHRLGHPELGEPEDRPKRDEHCHYCGSQGEPDPTAATPAETGDASRDEHAAWIHLCAHLEASGAVSAADLKSAPGKLASVGQRVLEATRAWGRRLAALHAGPAGAVHEAARRVVLALQEATGRPSEQGADLLLAVRELEREHVVLVERYEHGYKAWFEGRDERGQRGTGATPQAAVGDLMICADLPVRVSVRMPGEEAAR